MVDFSNPTLVPTIQKLAGLPDGEHDESRRAQPVIRKCGTVLYEYFVQQCFATENFCFYHSYSGTSLANLGEILVGIRYQSKLNLAQNSFFFKHRSATRCSRLWHAHFGVP